MSVIAGGRTDAGAGIALVTGLGATPGTLRGACGGRHAGLRGPLGHVQDHHRGRRPGGRPVPGHGLPAVPGRQERHPARRTAHRGRPPGDRADPGAGPRPGPGVVPGPGHLARRRLPAGEPGPRVPAGARVGVGGGVPGLRPAGHALPRDRGAHGPGAGAVPGPCTRQRGGRLGRPHRPVVPDHPGGGPGPVPGARRPPPGAHLSHAGHPTGRYPGSAAGTVHPSDPPNHSGSTQCPPTRNSSAAPTSTTSKPSSP